MRFIISLVKLFFKHKFVARKYACGVKALGFKAAEMLEFVKVKDMQISGDILRGFIRRKRTGCNGVKLRFVDSTPDCKTVVFFVNASNSQYSNERSGASLKKARENGEDAKKYNCPTSIY